MVYIKPPHEYIFIPLDTPDLHQAMEITKKLAGFIGGVKIGKEFFTSLGPAGVNKISALGIKIFVDLKFHDIPNTVAGAIRAAIHLKPSIINVHAHGGRSMLIAAREAAIEESNKIGLPPPLLLGVTVLTSIGDKDLKEIGINGTSMEQVKRLAILCQESGLDGVVCSAREINDLRQICRSDFKLLTPGIRPSWASIDDQKRTLTPGEAIRLGADYLVIGRPICKADDPVSAVKKVIAEIAKIVG